MSEEYPVIFNTLSEFKNKKNEMYNKINNTINKCVIDDEFEYNYMSSYGLTPRQRIYLDNKLNTSLKEFTQNKCDDWCDTTTSNLISGIEGFLNALIKINKIKEFNAEELAEIIYNSIVYQLGDDKHSPDLLEEVVEIIDYVDEQEDN